MTDLVAFEPGKVVVGRWKVVERVGSGGCGAVYKVEDQFKPGSYAALKAESNDVGVMGVLKLEVALLQKLEKLPDAWRLFDMGKRKKYSFMVMTLGGQDLLNIAMKSPKPLSGATMSRLGIMCLSSIKQIHDIGFIHRDVKPGNFVQATTNGHFSRIFYLIDFGLVRTYVSQTKKGDMKMRRARDKVALRGTFRYCSLNTHNRVEQGRVDDVIALMFVLQALFKGLPWDGIKDEAEIIKRKQAPDKDIFIGAPREYLVISEYLRRLGNTDRPDYVRLYRWFEQEMIREKVNFLTPYEWETVNEGEYKTMIEPSPEESKTLKADTDDILQYRRYPMLHQSRFEPSGVTTKLKK